MQRAVERVWATFPDPWQIAEWEACERWLPHVLIGSTWIKQAHLETSEASSLLYNAGYYLYERARYAEAEPLYQRALKIGEQQLGPDHPDVAHPLNNLANLYSEQGKYRDAEPLYQRALTIREQQLGPDHPYTKRVRENLARLLRDKEKKRPKHWLSRLWG